MAVLPPPGPSMAGAFPFMAAMNKSLAQMNKSPNEVRATKKRYERPAAVCRQA